MEKPRELLRRIGMLRHRNQVASELQEEMQLHLDLRRQQQVESGVAPAKRHIAASATRHSCVNTVIQPGAGAGSKGCCKTRDHPQFRVTVTSMVALMAPLEPVTVTV
jgi:hypothetical protein